MFHKTLVTLYQLQRYLTSSEIELVEGDEGEAVFAFFQVAIHIFACKSWEKPRKL